MTKEEILEAIEKMTVLELSQLVKMIEEKFDVSAAAPVMMGGMLAAAAPVEEKEQTEFDVIITFDVAVIEQGMRQLGQGFGQIAVVVQRLDQKIQRGAVVFAQAQAQRLGVQVVLHAGTRARQFGGAGGLFVAAGLGVVARRRLATPLAVVG